MRPLSILGLMLIVLLVAAVLALFARLGGEAVSFVAGPVLGTAVGGVAYRRDHWAILKGGAVGGLGQGVVAILFFKRGYLFPDIAMITGPLFLASLAVHLAWGLAFGALLHLALRWSRPARGFSR